MRYCADCELNFSKYINSCTRNVVYIVIFLSFVVATAVVLSNVLGAGGDNVSLEPAIFVKPGDPMAPRNTKVKLGSDFVIIGFNADDESIYFKDTTEVVIGDDTKGYSNPIKIKGKLE